MHWICQCKLVKAGKSLAASKVDVATPVLQHNPDGYLLMTNVQIDGTIYDLLDGIARTVGKACESRSKMEIERLLLRNATIRKRYFEKAVQ